MIFRFVFKPLISKVMICALSMAGTVTRLELEMDVFWSLGMLFRFLGNIFPRSSVCRYIPLGIPLGTYLGFFIGTNRII